jgi:nitrite reductase/ring-hydroxylating ferredoxin subunit
MPQRESLQPVDRPSGMNRRAFCASALAAGMVVACGGGGGSSPAPAPATPPPGPGPMTTADTKAALLATADGTTRDYRNLGNFFLIKDATGIYAMTTICTHMGCAVGVPVGSQITCPCHGSQYNLNGGNVVGPATSPLVHFQVTEVSPGGVLVVNTAVTVGASIRLT